MTTIIDLNDLRHSINRALNLGRYTIVVKTAGAEQVPASITLDLLERDDDGFKWPVEAEAFPEGMPSASRWATTTELPPKPCGECDGKGHVGPIQGRADAVQGCTVCMGLGYEEENDPAPVKRTVEEVVLKLSVDASDFEAQIAALTKKATETAVSLGRDDHGAAIPEQAESLVKGQFSEPSVYEFALQDAVFIGPNAGLKDIVTGNCPDLTAYAAADWVHVYDRVTRERRTLKRPEPDAVLTGLRDVAADLRGKTDDAMHRAAVEAGYASLEGYVEAKTPAADPMPPVGPLTSTEGLKAGDVLRVIDGGSSTGLTDGQIVTAIEPKNPGYVCHSANKLGHFPDRFAFVARPGVWMPWEGGENPVPGLWVKTKSPDNRYEGEEDASEEYNWSASFGHPIGFYMVVDTPPASSDT